MSPAPPRIYLDHNATTPVDPRAAQAMRAALEELAGGGLGNPSSVHAEGRRARDLVERARADVARLVGGTPAGVVFTSGGTEADAMGILRAARGAWAAGRPARVVASPLEHPAARGAVARLADEGFEVIWAPVDPAGRLDLDAVAAALAPGAALAVFALANHELGNVYPVAELAAAARRGGARLLVDAVQAAGKLAIDARALGADLVTVSAHKLGGPAGVGALWVAPGVAMAAPAAGGHQERGRRPGTENLVGVAGFGVAARFAFDEQAARATHTAHLRDRLEAGVRALGARVHGDPAARAPNTLNVAWDGVPGDVLVMALDLEGVAVSAGAACTSGSVEPSPVLLALGLERARAAEGVRFSLGPGNSADEIDQVLARLPGLLGRIRGAGGG